MNRLKPLGVLVVAVVIGCSVQPEATSTIVDVATAPGQVARFEPAAVTVAFAPSILVRFRNASTQAHNLVFVGELEAATRTIVEPGDADEVVVAVPGPGRYSFVCTIHESMQGSLTIGSATAAG